MASSSRIKWTEGKIKKLKYLRNLGLTTSEIADILETSIKTIEQTLYRYQIKYKRKLVLADLKELPPDKKLIDLMIQGQEIIREFDPRQREVYPSYNTDKWVGIPFFGDLHVDHYKTDLKGIAEDFDAVGGEQDVFPIVNGDFGDWADIRFPGYNLPGMILPMRLRYKLCHEILDKLKNLLAVTTGDHDDWLNNRGFFDIIGALQERRNEKGLKTYYLGYGGFINFKVGKNTYKLGVYHRYKHESKLNIFHPNINFLRDLAPDCDVVAIAHRHDTVGISYQMYQKQPRVFIRSGSHQYLTDYAWKYGFGGAIAMSPMVLLNGAKKQMIACPNYKEGLEELRRLNKE